MGEADSHCPLISFEIQKTVWDLQIPGCKAREDKDQICEVV